LLTRTLTEGRTQEALRVTLDGQGGFCLEFEAKDASDDATFGHDAVPELTIRVSDLTLVRLGGSTIDFRDGRFKLDLAEDTKKHACACESGGSCGCKE
jgi:Fe-S cluster assembly iron-binding protein IscA